MGFELCLRDTQEFNREMAKRRVGFPRNLNEGGTGVGAFRNSASILRDKSSDQGTVVSCELGSFIAEHPPQPPFVEGPGGGLHVCSV